MDTVEWLLLGLALLCCVPLPFLEAAERRVGVTHDRRPHKTDPRRRSDD